MLGKLLENLVCSLEARLVLLCLVLWKCCYGSARCESEAGQRDAILTSCMRRAKSPRSFVGSCVVDDFFNGGAMAYVKRGEEE